MMQSGNTSQLTFGIYPGGVAGTQTGLTEGPPDDPSQIKLALDRLQAEGRPLLVRRYKHFSRSSVGPAYGDDPAERFPAVVRAADALLAVQAEAA